MVKPLLESLPSCFQWYRYAVCGLSHTNYCANCWINVGLMFVVVFSTVPTNQMHSHTDGEMAIPRVFNSNTPFIIVSGGSELTFLSKEENNQGCEEEKESLVQAITPHLGRVMQHGTAKHMVTQGREESEENPCVSIVAQAESENNSYLFSLCIYVSTPL